ncbi:sensor domain-containing diguanylate cyclase [Litchfieldella xinjiangensis]|uniref:sensor domain-containing diguanylate cyclase n=1 Tax=Litchfieldella xinjiangensis TaxID=1166948 RepID=UPI0005BB9277|nr:diguanylate cyclase [Halomonas xinjiangensis]
MIRNLLSLPPVMVAVCWSLWLGLLPSLAQAAISIAESPDDLNPSPRVELLEDPERRYSIESLLEGCQALSWQDSEQEALNFSFSGSAWWVRFELVNDTSGPVRRLLELAMPMHDYLDAWVVNDGGAVVQSWQTGDRRGFDSRPVAHRTFVFPLYLAPGEAYSVLLRLDTHDGLFDATPLYLMEDERFLAKSQRELMAFSLYFGALLALMIYNLLLFLATRERILLHYVVYLGSFFLLMFLSRGFAFQYWWPNWPTFNNQLVPVNIGLFAVALAIFSDSYLNLPRHSPRLSSVVRWVAFLSIVSTLPALWGNYGPLFLLIIPSAILLSMSLLVLAAWRSWRGDILARLYLVAWSVLLVGITLYLLRVAGVLPYNLITEYAIQVGSSIEFLLLALGLAWKINRLKNDKIAAERATLEMQRLANQRLEEQVMARTLALEEANRQLVDMARTDPLTGLLNRRQFGECLDEELRRSGRSGQPLLFAVMDIDAFKTYNDTYGHQAGDEVLVRVAALLHTHFRRSGDRLFRLGGEEFGLLFEADSLEAGYEALERFRASLEALGITHRGAAHGVITASFGLVTCEDQSQIVDAQSLYFQADQAMYEAKAQSRNRIVTRHLASAREGLAE